MMNTLTEEILGNIYGGTEFPPENGSSGGGDRIKAGDWVTWNGHEDLGKGYVDCVIWGFAHVIFNHTKFLHTIQAVVNVKNLSLVR